MTRTLRLSAMHVEAFRGHLLRADGQERFAFLYCSESGDDLVATEVVPVADEDLAAQGRGECRPALDVERDRVAACRRRGMHPAAVHSHPFSDRPGFSGRDLDIMERYGSWLAGLYPDVVPVFAVVGTEGVETAVYDPAEEGFASLPVEVVGDWTLDPSVAVPDEDGSAGVDRVRYDRSIRMLTEAGQEALAGTHVAVVGVGGLGSLMAEELVRYGVGEVTVVDPDVVEASNLPRLFGAAGHHVGRPKVEAVKEHLWRVNPDVGVTAVQAAVEDAADAVSGCDVIVGGVDRVSARSFLNEVAVRHVTPYVDAGVVIETDEDTVTGMEGIIQLVAPGATACFDCLDRGDPEAARVERLSPAERDEELERGYIAESDLVPEPAVVPLNGVVGSMAVSVVAKLVTGYAEPPGFLRFEGVGNDLVEVSTSRDVTCVTCGRDGVLGRGDRAGSAAEFDAADLDLALADGRVETDGGTAADAGLPGRVAAVLSRLGDRFRGGGRR